MKHWRFALDGWLAIALLLAACATTTPIAPPTTAAKPALDDP